MRELNSNGMTQEAFCCQKQISSEWQSNRSDVLPFFDQHQMGILRILIDRGTEYCGKSDLHDYQLFLAIHNIDHTKTKARHPQTNGICERFHKTILNEFYQIAFRKKIFGSLEEFQKDLDHKALGDVIAILIKDFR